MNIYPHIDQTEIERQYFLRGLRPDYETTLLPKWIEKSNRLLETTTVMLDLQYGTHERNRLDFFPAKYNTGDFVLYIHGGYWQRGDKSVYRFLAQALLDQGISVALINYPMCPNIRFSQIAVHVRHAVDWLWGKAEELNISRDKFNIIGHSAGGHLTAEMLMTDWPDFNNQLPAHLAKSAVALSGIYDLEPLLFCSENERLKLDEEQVKSASPMNRQVSYLAPMLIGYGDNEPDDMHRQSTGFYEKFKSSNPDMQCFCIAQADHFDVVNVLADPASELFSKTMEFVLI